MKELPRSKNEIHAIITNSTQRDEIIMELAQILHQQGMVDHTYGEQVIEREKVYPTGVPTQPVAVAVPHSERSAVFKTGVGVAVLKNSAQFASMEGQGKVLDVKVVFMLAVSSNDGHLEMIHDIMEIIQDKDVVAELLNAPTNKEIEEVMHREFSQKENKRTGEPSGSHK